MPAVAPETLDAVLVSHLHPDHFIDLVPFRHYLRYYLEPPRRIRVLGPQVAADLHEAADVAGEDGLRLGGEDVACLALPEALRHLRFGQVVTASGPATDLALVEWHQF